MMKWLVRQAGKIGRLMELVRGIRRIEENSEKCLFLAARPLIERNNARRQVKDLSEVEFRVFSQAGDDGIIQYLVHRLAIKETTFIEFGVETYEEATTRFLLQYSNWSGLIMDGSVRNVRYIKSKRDHFAYDLVVKDAFVTTENINDLVEAAGFRGRIGLLHIDIDGNDYWVWRAIEVVDPVLVIVEYNGLFGSERPITVPYRPDFCRTAAHHSNLYYGASISSLVDLGRERGYAFIGCNSHGNNAYFVKREMLRGVKEKTVAQGFVAGRFRESRDEEGHLRLLRWHEGLDLIRGMPVVNTRTGREETL